jgi:cell pole-organizing protein PopZ
MTQPAKSQEPSMEEILASIRRIIADDDATKTVPQQAEQPRAEAHPAPLPPQSMPSHAMPQPEPVHNAPRAEPEPLPEESVDEAVAEQSADILDLTESMAAPMPQPSAEPMPSPAPQFRTIDGNSDVGFDEAAERPAAAPVASPLEHSAEERGRLLSRQSTAAVDSAFNALAQTVLAQNARTLEDLVRDMLRPMLKNWLDDNLPGMVERLVRAEIERVSRGRNG